MKYDWDLIRTILQRAANVPKIEPYITPNEGDQVEAQHMVYLIESGYCDGSFHWGEDGTAIARITGIRAGGRSLLESLKH